MSKNIIIQISGTPATFDATPRLRTDGVGVGRIGWIPETESRTGALAVNKNGEYTAASKGVYGFSKAVVKVPADSVTGKKSDGNSYTISTDASGNIVETKVPSEIRITTPPALLEYTDGETIDFTGLSVTAYDGNGQSMGAVPFEELILPMTTAEYDPSAGPIEELIETDLDVGAVDSPFPTSESISGSAIWQKPGGQVGYMYNTDFSASGAKLMLIYAGDNQYAVVAASKTPATLTVHAVAEGVFPERTRTFELALTTLYGETFYGVSVASAFFGPYESGDEPIEPVSIKGAIANGGNEAHLNGEQVTNLEYAMLFGSVAGYGGGVNVPVQWPRTGDGNILETSFGISVTDGN